MAAVASALEQQEPLLVACLGSGDRRRDDAAMLADVAGRLRGLVRVLVLDEACFSAFSRCYDVVGTPTYLLFVDGRVQGQVLGRTESTALCAMAQTALQGGEAICGASEGAGTSHR
ncbi:MAG: hypothetical protein AB7E47_03890 [Desulfovibrionaceae bacterium]